MAKGLAVISGSNTVVFKALENGVVKMGGVDSNLVLKPAQVTISGSLTLSGSEGVHLHISGSEFKLENLSGEADKIVISGLDDSVSDFGQQPDVGAVVVRDMDYQLKKGLLWAATSSAPQGALEDKTTDPDAYYAALEAESGSLAPEDFLVITENGELRRVNKIDASVVMLNDGQTVEQQVGGLNLNLRRTSAHGEAVDDKDVNLTKGRLEFKDVDTRTKITMEDSESGESVQVTVDLDPNLQVETLSASMGLEVTGSSNLRGKLTVSDFGAEIDGDLNVHSNATIDGKLTVEGDLEVRGNISQINIEQKNLVIDDAIVLIGSGSSGVSSLELGFVFGSTSSKAFTLKDGDFYLGATNDDTLDTDLSPDNDGSGKLVLANLSASATVNALDLQVANSATITGKLTANGNVDLGDAASDIVEIKGTLSASAPARFSAQINVDSGADVVLEAGSDLTLDQGSVTLTQGNLAIGTGDINVTLGSMTLSEGNVTLTKGDLSMVEGSATLTKGDLTLSEGSVTLANGDLEVSGHAKLSASAGASAQALEVSGTMSVSSSAGINALHVEGGDVLVDNALTVDGVVSLNGAQGALNIAGAWTQDAAVKIAGSLDVAGNVRLGSNELDTRVIVQGQFRIPKLSMDVAEEAAIINQFADSPADFEGYTFYLSSATTKHASFPNDKKWYFNEGGVWHSSFFWDDSADQAGADGL